MLFDEMDLNVLRQIRNAVIEQTKAVNKINATLKKLNQTLECFGDFKP